MARYTGMDHSDKIITIAGEWRDRCLVGDGSMFGGADVWTPGNVDALQADLVEGMEQGGDDFLAKLRGPPQGAWLDTLHRTLDGAVAAAYG